MSRLAIVSRDFETYRQLFKSDSFHERDITLMYAGESPTAEVFEHADILLSEPDIAANFIQEFTKLKWLHSTWAGNNRLQQVEKHDYILTATKGIFGAQMREYVFAYILFFHRKLTQAHTPREWRSVLHESLEGKRLGIMGLGNIGYDLANIAYAFGMNISAITASQKPLAQADYFSLDHINQFAKDCDYIVNLLPETQLTIGKCDNTFFEHMKSSAVFINAGRGSIIDSEQTIIDALSQKIISAAVLDVFVHEPLAKNHPFYSLENCYITDHSAAVSDPKKVYRVFADNLKRYQASKALLYQHDFLKAY